VLSCKKSPSIPLERGRGGIILDIGGAQSVEVGAIGIGVGTEPTGALRGKLVAIRVTGQKGWVRRVRREKGVTLTKITSTNLIATAAFAAVVNFGLCQGVETGIILPLDILYISLKKSRLRQRLQTEQKSFRGHLKKIVVI
jgi:hypothetical protein